VQFYKLTVAHGDISGIAEDNNLITHDMLSGGLI
jgi:hypothetical protein